MLSLAARELMINRAVANLADLFPILFPEDMGSSISVEVPRDHCLTEAAVEAEASRRCEDLLQQITGASL